LARIGKQNGFVFRDFERNGDLTTTRQIDTGISLSSPPRLEETDRHEVAHGEGVELDEQSAQYLSQTITNASRKERGTRQLGARPT
jgi:hypothetical protein